MSRFRGSEKPQRVVAKEDGTVTVPNRNDAGYIRIDKSRCLEYLRERLKI